MCTQPLSLEHPMTSPISFPGEDQSNAARRTIARQEPQALRTFTPTQAVLARSEGVFHYTPEGRRLYDFSSGVLVVNLGHNPRGWMKRFVGYMGWKPETWASASDNGHGADSYFSAIPLTAYNAVTPVEAAADKRLLA